MTPQGLEDQSMFGLLGALPCSCFPVAGSDLCPVALVNREEKWGSCELENYHTKGGGVGVGTSQTCTRESHGQSCHCSLGPQSGSG